MSEENAAKDILTDTQASEGADQVENDVELSIVDNEAVEIQEAAEVKSVKFAPLTGSSAGSNTQNTMDLLYDVNLEVTVELGRASLPVKEILQLGAGSIVELNKLGGEPVDVLVNGRPIARGEVVVVDENFGVRITELVSRG